VALSLFSGMRARTWPVTDNRYVSVIVDADSSVSFTLVDVHDQCVLEVLWHTLFRSYQREQIRQVS